MKKPELKSGMKVVVESGREYILAQDDRCSSGMIGVYLHHNKGCMERIAASVLSWNRDDPTYNIVAVYNSTCFGSAWGELVWKKSETPLMDNLEEGHGADEARKFIEELLERLEKTTKYSNAEEEILRNSGILDD